MIVSGSAVAMRFPGLSFESAIPFALFLMLYPPMLDVETSKVKRIATEPRLAFIALGINFLLSPVLVFSISRAFVMESSPGFMAGFIVFGLMPCGGMVPAYTDMLKGDVNFSLTVVAVSILSSAFIVPLWITLLLGRSIHAPYLLILKYLLIYILTPLLAAASTRALIIRFRGNEQFASARLLLKSLSGYGLMLMLFSIFASRGRALLNQSGEIEKVLAAAFAFLLFQLFFSIIAGRIARSTFPQSIALTISVTAKNTALSLALTTSIFGAEATSAVAAAGFLVQLPLMLAFLRTGELIVKRVASLQFRRRERRQETE